MKRIIFFALLLLIFSSLPNAIAVNNESQDPNWSFPIEEDIKILCSMQMSSYDVLSKASTSYFKAYDVFPSSFNTLVSSGYLRLSA